MSAEQPTPEQAAFLADLMLRKNETRRPGLIAAICVCIVIAYVAVGLRLLARRRVHQPLKADDWWIIGALIPVTLFDGFNFWTMSEGMGLHIVRLTDPKGFMKSSVGCMILYGLCLPPVKFSILCLYHRIFPSKGIKYGGIAIGAIVGGTCIAATLAFAFQCIPLSSLWENPTGGTRCIDISNLAMSTGVINIVTDVAILALPVRPLLNLKAPIMVRAGLIGTFLLGGAVCVFSIVRTIMVHQASFDDPTWNNAPGATWSVIENHIAILCACLPVLKPLFIKPKSGLPTAKSSGYKSSGYIRSADSKPRGKKDPYGVTDGSITIVADEDDDVPLHSINKTTHFETGSVRDVPMRERDMA
ncbi:hypothetical protein BDV96DRAFT_596922 [Lophiotrema nucula]|uniref:Rhodopsin domain-containing protein n=1 Tax=Lophiotrema nucula TaxID=690887 RepID=A0A6A5ZJD7_9PLEO|nr:hypothetical protein BDV96DRAFT_596922 [Lophiotrema nucula]